MTVHGNGGTLTTNVKVHVLNCGEVWFDANAITNILSLKNVREKFHVTCDSRNGNSAFVVRRPNRSGACFVMCTNGLHCHDTSNGQLAMALTVKEESEGFSKQQIAQAKKARVFKGSSGVQALQNLS